MSHAPRRFPQVALGVGTLALAALLTGCGSGGGNGGPADTPTPSTSTVSGGTGGAQGAATQAPDPVQPATPGMAASSSVPAGGTTAGTSRCHTSELSASVGRNEPGAGQENFAVVLTYVSSRTCAVTGYPGAAFTDSGGKQLGPDPSRATSTGAVVTLTPGHSAWSGLSFANPEVSGAATATPAFLLVTPPNERNPLRVPWSGGAVPVSGSASTATVTVLAPGSGT